jgi:hypothetical protein
MNVVSEGYDDTIFTNGFNIISELRGDELLLQVSNPREVNYKLYFVYKYKCEDKNGYSRERVYKGNDTFYPVLISIPSNKNCDQSVKVVLRDFNDKLLYDSPIMVVKNIERKNTMNTINTITE